jgi:hypothetical protein
MKSPIRNYYFVFREIKKGDTLESKELRRELKNEINNFIMVKVG